MFFKRGPERAARQERQSPRTGHNPHDDIAGAADDCRSRLTRLRELDLDWHRRAAARTPRTITERLNKELNAILQMPEVQTIARNDGSVITGETPEDFHATLMNDLGKFAKLVKAAGIKMEQ